MKLLLSGIFVILFVESSADWTSVFTFPVEAAQGAGDMWNAYQDMRESKFPDSDKYFHARGNFDAANRGPGGKWAAEVISDTREWWQGNSGRGFEDSEADQRANRHGREGNDPNFFRPPGLPDKY